MGRNETNGDVEAAIEERDELLEKIQGAVEKVDRLKDELLEEYAQADARRAKERR